MNKFFIVCSVLLAIKVVTIGGDFNFIHWAKYGKLYSEWYENRQTFNEFMDH